MVEFKATQHQPHNTSHTAPAATPATRKFVTVVVALRCSWNLEPPVCYPGRRNERTPILAR